MMQCNWVDLLILGVIALSMLTGIMRGFIKELIAICVWAAAIWTAFHCTPLVDPWLVVYIKDATLRKIVDVVVIVVSVLIIGGLLSTFIGLVLKNSGLSATDRILGLIFGFVRGVVIIALVMVALMIADVPYQQYSKNSQLYSKFNPLTNLLYLQLKKIINTINPHEVKKNIKIVNGNQLQLELS